MCFLANQEWDPNHNPLQLLFLCTGLGCDLLSDWETTSVPKMCVNCFQSHPVMISFDYYQCRQHSNQFSQNYLKFKLSVLNVKLLFAKQKLVTVFPALKPIHTWNILIVVLFIFVIFVTHILVPLVILIDVTIHNLGTKLWLQQGKNKRPVRRHWPQSQ